MDFAFIIHPMNVNDIVTRFKGTKRLPREFVEKWFSRLPAFKYSKIEGIKSQSTGRTISGIFIGCPLTTEQMLSFPEHYVVQKIIKAGRVAEKAGAGIVGLGAMTSVVADAGITIAQQLKIPVTTGSSYTVAMAMERVLRRLRLKWASILRSPRGCNWCYRRHWCGVLPSGFQGVQIPY